MGTLTYDNNLRAGAIGAGNQLGWHELHAYREARGVVLGGCCDLRPEAAANFAATHAGVAAYPTATALVGQLRPDIVDIVTPAGAHLENVRAVLEVEGVRPMAFWIEKPSAPSVAVHDEIAQLIAKHRGIVVFGYDKLYNPHVEWARGLIRDGIIGKVYRVDARWNRTKGAPRGGFLSRAVSGGGPGFDLGSHLVALMMFLLDDGFATVSGVTSRAVFDAHGTLGNVDHAETTVEDAFYGTAITARRGASVAFQATWDDVLEQDEWHFVVKGTRGTVTLALERLSRTDEQIVASAQVRPWDGIGGERIAADLVLLRPEEPAFSLQRCRQALLEELVSAVTQMRNGFIPSIRADAAFARGVLAALEAGYQSAADGHHPVAVTT